RRHQGRAGQVSGGRGAAHRLGEGMGGDAGILQERPRDVPRRARVGAQPRPRADAGSVGACGSPDAGRGLRVQHRRSGATVIATVVDTKTGPSPVSIADLPQRLASGGFSWLDIEGASAEELQAVATVLRLGDPTRSWLPRFGQRARFEMGPQVRISTFTAGATGSPVEVHVLYTASWLLTVRADVGTVAGRAHAVYGTFGGDIASNH